MTAPQIKSAARRRAMRSSTGQHVVKRAVVYVRMSMDRTGEGEGIERQETACRALCLARGWDVVTVIDDTISATEYRLSERPGWRKVVSMVEAGEVDVIVAFHLDRVTRDMKDLETLIELAVDRGIGLSTATGDIDLTTDAGRMVARILAAVAKAEGERKAERMILANDQRVEQGRQQWIRRPFGFELDGTHRPDEAAAVKKAYADFLGGKRMAAICREWNAAGLRTTAPEQGGKRALQGDVRKVEYSPTGEWSQTALREFLLHPRNAGIITLYDEEAGRGQWEPLVDEETFRAVQLKLAEGKRPKGGQSLLSGIATCDRCGDLVFASRDAQRGATYRDRAGHFGIARAYVDDLVRDRVVLAAVRAGKRSLYDHSEPSVTVDVPALKAREQQIAELMSGLIRDAAAGLIDRAAMIEGTKDLRAERADVQRQIAAAGKVEAVPKRRPVTARKALEGAGEAIDLMRSEWEMAELHEQRNFVEAWLKDGVRITPGVKGRHTTDKHPQLHPGRVITERRSK